MNSKLGPLFCILLSFGTVIRQTDMAYLNVAEFFNITNGNLSSITWAHAVNSKSELAASLNSSIMMLEADVVIGKINNSGNEIPIMAHPPANTSDLSLSDFLSEILEFNLKANSQAKKGVKLDFKSIEALENSLDELDKLYANMSYPVWINADIISGPVNATGTPVDPARFFKNTKHFQNSTLSIGWTTNYGQNFSTSTYSNDQITNMLDVILQNNVSQSITFPVRAGIAAESATQMRRLLSDVTNSTLTIWSGDGDNVNAKKLQQLILSVGVNKTYIDVPDALLKEINLSGSSSVAKTTLKLLGIALVAILVL
ncbi:hypothetical protein AMK59_8299 [Oryctes borbonicus]|uniref:Menorin-like domain-containing protein n=1 Tax=Oryctes borbonicus TaxID=1629725 RepID=A0A0T6AUV1_9SCAR|nr:hypothetical protein AMK59_8299 [Oryctes borbonicus]